MKDKRFLRMPPLHRCGWHAGAAYKRQEAAPSASERHEGPGQDGMRPASPRMSGLPVLPLGLLLLALHAPQAPGQPIGTDSSTYSPLINEIQAILNEPPVPSPVSNGMRLASGREGLAVLRPKRDSWPHFLSPPQDRLSSNEKFILRVRAQPHTWVHSCLGGGTSDMPHHFAESQFFRL